MTRERVTRERVKGPILALCVLGLALTAAADGLRDPTRPPLPENRAAPAAREPAPVLSAVLSFGGERTAIFNGHLVRPGSVVGHYTIDSILEDGVRYTHASSTHELHLAHDKSTIKKPAAEAARAPAGVP
jgi:hypothetical protein